MDILSINVICSGNQIISVNCTLNVIISVSPLCNQIISYIFSFVLTVCEKEGDFPPHFLENSCTMYGIDEKTNTALSCLLCTPHSPPGEVVFLVYLLAWRLELGESVCCSLSLLAKRKDDIQQTSAECG